MNGIRIEISNGQSFLPVDEVVLERVMQAILQDAAVSSAEISLAVVNDARIHQLNREYLRHDYATDVLSFPLSADLNALEGEIVVSAETAVRRAPEFDADPRDELLLYVIHGVLHLIGHGDKSAEEVARMRALESQYLRRFGVGRRPSPASRAAGCPGAGEREDDR